MTILFYPDNLTPKTKMYHLCKRFGIKYHNDPTRPYDLHIFWSYTRDRITPGHITLNGVNVINRGCYDITKIRVNDIFDSRFIDPLIYQGEAVQKQDQQGQHFMHSIVKCPLKPLQGYIYQKLIVDKVGHLFIRYRVYYSGGITHVVRIYQKDLFETKIERCELIDKRDVFCDLDEQILEDDCDNFGFDHGELDVMIDLDKPVVIDVNNVVGGATIPGLTDTEYAKDIQEKSYQWLKTMAE